MKDALSGGKILIRMMLQFLHKINPLLLSPLLCMIGWEESFFFLSGARFTLKSSNCLRKIKVKFFSRRLKFLLTCHRGGTSDTPINCMCGIVEQIQSNTISFIIIGQSTQSPCPRVQFLGCEGPRRALDTQFFRILAARHDHPY